MPTRNAGPTCSYCQSQFGTSEELGDHLLEEHAAGGSAPTADQDGLIYHEVLKPEEELELCRLVRSGATGAAAARERLIAQNQRLVYSVARKYKASRMSFPDLVQEGNLGLMKAIAKFDPERGFRLATYAVWWIKNKIRAALVNETRTVRVPANVIMLAGAARKLIEKGCTIEEASKTLGHSPEEVGEALEHLSARSVSMEADSDDTEGLGSALASPEVDAAPFSPDEIERLLSVLSEDHRAIIVRRYGLDGNAPISGHALSVELGVSPQRVYQIEADALAHIRKNCVLAPEDDSEVRIVEGAHTLPRIRKFRDLERFQVGPEIPATQKTPLPHQEEAVAAILAEFASRDRATAVMACGTGKTLVGLWAYQRSGAKTAALLAPSLALLRQTLREWRAHGAADRYLCVCSDATVSDEWETRLEARDLGIPVTTEPAEVRAWLKAHAGERLLVLSTYQSSRELGASLPPGFSFDLAIFDEAHRTAGARDRHFSYALTDSQFPVKKRLFLTATPRGTMTDGSEASPFSMADEKSYGRFVYELGLADAIARGIICDYKVVIAVVTKSEIARLFSRAARVKTKSGHLTAREAAYYIAFARAVQECGVSKIITFHGGVESAQRFYRSRWLREDLLPEAFHTYHVNGTMSAAMRQAILARFSQVEASLVTNARCLNEGVDVPAVDMVAFMSPKKSRTDILQTIGRALRKAPGKTVGYVMLPVLIDEAGNPLSTAAEYRDLSEVIYSLRSQDKAFDTMIRLNAFRKGRGHAAAAAELDEKVVFVGPEIMPEDMRRAITARVLTPEGASWDEMFGRLVAFKKTHGTFYITSEGDLQLRNWMIAQRARRRNRRLSPRQLTLLDSIGFPWNPQSSAWTKLVAALGAWKAKHGHFKVPRSEGKLCWFVPYVRRQRKRGKLSQDRVAELDAMGFEWNADRTITPWEKYFESVSKLVERGGWPSMKKAPWPIRRWLSNQRKARRRGKLDQKQVSLLRGIGMPWKMREERLTTPRRFDTKKREVGAVVTRRQWSNGRDVQERWIKVSDTGPVKWKPYARWWWEQNRGPVPKGHGVIHINGDSYDDRPENLMVGTAADRMRLAHKNNPEMSKRNLASCRKGTADFNRRMGKQNRMKTVIQKYFYPVVEEEQVILNCPFRRRSTLLRHFGADTSKIPACGLGPEVEKAIQQAGVRPVHGHDLKSAPYADFMRLDPELGIADPGKVADAEGRRRRLERMPLWEKALRAAALDLKDRK